MVWATLLKCFVPRLKVVWHDHYGNSEMLSARPSFVLKILAPYWCYVFSVNQKLETWAIEQLGVPQQKVSFLNNFAALTDAALMSTE